MEKQDAEIIRHLGADGRLSPREIAEAVGLSRPTVQSRIKQMIKSGVLKIRGLVDQFKIDGLVTALVAIKVKDDRELDDKVEQLAALENIDWVVVVTGRYDLFVQVVLLDGMPGLYNFLTHELPQLGGIDSSESFVVMQAKKNWIMLPKEPKTRVKKI